MKEIVITALEAGQRMDKLLGRYLKEAPKSFVYKMLRKKNITLNGKKADGSEKLQEEDIIRIYFAEETLKKFCGEEAGEESSLMQQYPGYPLDVIYEDQNVLLVNKPAGMLSQKAKPEDVSLVEYLIGYLLRKGELSAGELSHFHPSVCNRLDRNTSGIVVAGKTMAGLQELGKMFHDRAMCKYYRCLVKGEVRQSCYLEGYLKKDEIRNQVSISKEKTPDSQLIRTEYVPVKTGNGLTLLEVHLITGRSHQIRAHLASIGHPIAGDTKYGDSHLNQRLRDRYGLRYQLLHSYRMELPSMDGALDNLSGKTFTAPLPDYFQRILKGEMGEDRKEKGRK